MAGEELLSLIPPELVGRVEFLITILQAVGIFIIFYIVFNTINLFLSRRKKKELAKINENLEDIKKILRGKRK